MSLLEVLISIFVLSIGLLGVAAMIPVGRYEMVEGAKADRSSTLGRAGLRDVKVRRMLEFYQFDSFTPAATSAIEMWYQSGVASAVANGTTRYVLIDPYYLSKNTSSAAVWKFPNDNSGGTFTMPRIDLRVAPSSTNWMRTTLAEEIFVSHDDLVFDIPKEAGQRPTKVLSTVTSQQQFEGNYSWMVMARYDTTYVSGTTDPTPRATMWVVVFYKRNTLTQAGTTNAERAAQINFTGEGLSGGDATITWANSADADADAERLKSNEWLFVAGSKNPPNVEVGAWYRIVNVAEGTSNTRYVTLAGPDWPVNQYPGANCQAVLLGGVVNVFTETVELDRDLLRVAK